MKFRLDKLVLETGAFSSRTRAIESIENGGVKVDGKFILKPGKKIDKESKIEIVLGESRWVSRGAHKLIHALDYWNINVSDKKAIDIGASTGGFTQVLLERKINKVYCIDVGQDQLKSQIKNDPRVINYEKTHVKKISQLNIDNDTSIIVIDVSFISLKKVIPFIKHIKKSEVIFLIKPQFEVGPENINKHGVVKDQSLYKKVIMEIKHLIINNNYSWEGVIESPIKGANGNIEFLAYAKN
ncbi:MAG: TlyA family rRNA (cytidine-2'-O)-methyltransferase [Crocinitomicaceae bacterium]|nr:TlyA family rRNA (cytidine-2'-O)-methyltransferase [Crocinitomicaceae bacterium]